MARREALQLRGWVEKAMAAVGVLVLFVVFSCYNSYDDRMEDMATIESIKRRIESGDCFSVLSGQNAYRDLSLDKKIIISNSLSPSVRLFDGEILTAKRIEGRVAFLLSAKIGSVDVRVK